MSDADGAGPPGGLVSRPAQLGSPAVLERSKMDYAVQADTEGSDPSMR